MDERSNGNFLDKNTLLAIGLSILFFIGWQQYLEKKYPTPVKPTAKAGATIEQKAEQTSASEVTTAQEKQKVFPEAVPMELAKPQTIAGENSHFRYVLTNQGMGFQEIELLQFTDRQGAPIKFDAPSPEQSNLATVYEGKPVVFQIEERGPNHYVGIGQIGEQTLQKEILIEPSRYTFSVRLKTLSGQAQSGEKLITVMTDRIIEEESSFLMPTYEGTEFFTVSEGSENRERLARDTSFSEKWKATTVAAVGSQYFTVAIKDLSPIIPTGKAQFVAQDAYATAQLIHEEKTNGKQTDIQMTAFIGPKQYDLLKGIDLDFTRTINYGIFSFLCKPMLSLLRWLNDLFKNWGLAIIFLTILVRLLLLPINISSLKSMRKMQKIQPQIKAIREKFKDDPQRMNMETMALMKKEKANPLGGCLPMLLQLPVFFALYSVLGQSVELYKSPFIFWIQDLSYKDPYFVLPVAVGALYFIQMNITPQPTMDPTQAKMMKFIPVLFSFFMFAVPSGLTLYFFVNTVFGIGQQLIFQREKTKVAA